MIYRVSKTLETLLVESLVVQDSAFYAVQKRCKTGVPRIGKYPFSWALPSRVFCLAHETDFIRETCIPTDPFSISKPKDKEIGEFYVVQRHRAADLKAPKL